MRNSILLAVFSAAIAVVPASANSANFSFTGCSGSGGTQCSSDLSSYGPVSSSSTLNGVTVTATATAVYITGTSSGPTSGGTLATGEVGSYSGDGLGVCENQSGDNCQVPNHQVNNGADTTLSGGNGSGPDNFEFILLKFSAPVDLTSIQLGNFGTTGSTSDPFNATYYVSSSSASSITLNGTTLAGLTADGFGSANSTTCSSGTCAVNGVGTDTLGNNDVTYLLFGASTANNAAGTDFFKIQQLNVTNYTSGSSTPEPATFGLFGFALAGLGWFARKRKQN